MANKVRRPRLTLARPTTIRLCLRPVLCPFADRLHRGKWTSTYTHRAEASLHLSSGAVKRVPQGWLSTASVRKPPFCSTPFPRPNRLGSRARKWGPFAFSGLRLLKAKSPHTRTRPLTTHRAHQQGGRPCACRVDDGQVRRTRHAHRSSFSGVSVYARKVLSLMRIASA